MARWSNGGHGDMDVGNVDDDGAGFVKYGPLDVREKMRDANAVVRAVYDEVAGAYDKDHKAVPKDFLHQLTLLKISWDRLFDRFNGLPGAVGQFRDTMFERADLYTRTAVAFQQGFRTRKWLAAPVAPPAPKKAADAVTRPPDDVRVKTLEDGKWKWWQWALLGTVVAGGSYAAYRAWPREKQNEISDAEALRYLQSKGNP